tara:strand:- start:543 stop:1139 length:597 start_codon:yes stop_codon:yes gene_type:complete
MKRNRDNKDIWSLTVIRDGKQDYTTALCEADFKYGRTAEELAMFDVKRLPDGLIQLVEEHPLNLYEEALETGFVIEMTKYGSKVDGWMKFTAAIKMNSLNPFESPRGLYSNEIGSTIQFMKVGCPHGSTTLPNVVWIRVKELPLNYLAWACDNGVLCGEDGHQMKLDVWTDLPLLGNPEEIPTLILPGPSDNVLQFLG